MILLLFAFVGGIARRHRSVGQAAPKAVIFPFELIDISIQGTIAGPRTDKAPRLVLVPEELRRLASHKGGYEVLDLGGFASEIERFRTALQVQWMRGRHCAPGQRRGRCNGAVRKVSNLILNIHIYVRDVGSGKLTKVLQADVRGITDASWLSGIHRLVASRLLAGQIERIRWPATRPNLFAR